MDNIANICLVGAGNVAHHIGHAIKNAGLQISSIFGRKEDEAKELIDMLGTNTTYQDDLDFRKNRDDLIILCVSDDALEKVIKQLKAPKETIIVHTSGAIDLRVFASNQEISSYGVLYPLQTFSKNRKVDFASVPLLVESSDYSTRSRLLKLANELSEPVSYASSEERKQIHLAAVFANNFTNHLLKLAYDQLSPLQIDRQLLRPLILETVLKAVEEGPEASQTGPARRGDKKTISAHLELLSDNPAIKEIYQIFSEQIKSHFTK